MKSTKIVTEYIRSLAIFSLWKTSPEFLIDQKLILGGLKHCFRKFKMIGSLIVLRPEMGNIDSSVVVQELELEVKRYLDAPLYKLGNQYIEGTLFCEIDRKSVV